VGEVQLSTEEEDKESFSERENILIELCVRTVLCNLLDKDKDSIEDFTAGLHNLNIGCFGNKQYKFEDTNDWISCLEDLRSIVRKLDPEHEKRRQELKSEYFMLEEELKK